MRLRDHIGRARWWWWFAGPPRPDWMWHYKRQHRAWLEAHHRRWATREPRASRPHFQDVAELRRAAHSVGNYIAFAIGQSMALLVMLLLALVTDMSLLAALWSWVLVTWFFFGVRFILLRRHEP